MAEPLVSIVLPHYQTPELAQLCLRSIRRYTKGVPYEVIVIDNGSTDGASLEYLRQVEWIRLIERTENIGAVGLGHKEAVDMGIRAARGPLVLAFHTDTIPIREDWLSWHVAQIDASEKIGAVGTYKLELKSPWRHVLKQLEPLMFWKNMRAEVGDHEPYIRSHCALYRKELLERFNLWYNAPAADVAGRNIHYGLIEHGYEAKLLDVEETLLRVVHLNHGTMVLRPELGARKRTVSRGVRRIEAFFEQGTVQDVYFDATLDRGDPEGLLRAA